jgi:hypothetical protein
MKSHNVAHMVVKLNFIQKQVAYDTIATNINTETQAADRKISTKSLNGFHNNRTKRKRKRLP